MESGNGRYSQFLSRVAERLPEDRQKGAGGEAEGG